MTVSPHQVLQRGVHDRGLAPGGPYSVDEADDVYVGDLWVLAGQSNMEGVADLVDVETPDPQVHSFQSKEEWAVAEEPLHWLGESPRLVHHKLWGRETVEIDAVRDPNRAKGAGLGLSFAKARVSDTGVPVGLIPSAHGGTSMTQWNPEWRGDGGASLYGATLERVKACGGRVAGVLWYQGESDCSPADAAVYTPRMEALIAAFRADFGQPDLPFYLVQLGPFAIPHEADGAAAWTSVREQQRLLSQFVPNVKMASAIDLELDDLIHIGTQGFKRLGKRLAVLANGGPTLDVASVARDGFVVRVEFSGVQGSLQSAGRASGFSVRGTDGGDMALLYKTTLDGTVALLHLNEGDGPPPAGAHICYGYGFNPYCNITDAADNAVPAFGPLPLL